MLEGGLDGVCILQRQLLVIHEHLDRVGDRFRASLVDGRQHPRGFRERQVRYPRAAGDERFGGRKLTRVVAREQPDQHIGVNGSHGAS